METKRLVSIIIVNYKTPQLTINCLQSIAQDLSENFSIFVTVADNYSRDGSASIMKAEIERSGWNSWVTVLPLEKNGGFAYGNNRAIEKVFERVHLPDYLWLLNPDTVVHRGACEALVKFFSTHPKVGIVGSRLEEPDGAPQVSAFRDHSVINELLSGFRLGILDAICSRWIVAPNFVSETPHQTDWVSGASFMVRREVFEQTGLFDEKYFMYYEEVDFCLRTRENGWTIWYVPESRVIHFIGGASGISDSGTEENRRPPCWFESRRRFFLKNHGWLTLLVADILGIIGFSIWRVRLVLQRKPDLDPPHFLKDFFRQSFFYKGFRL
jgi:GT2 family glycosyltransferase